MSWWESAYRSGHVNWDPGEYDRHLDHVLERSGLAERRGNREAVAVDLGCGNGKSVVWLAEQGFQAWGIDLAATAIKQARQRAVEHGVAGRVHLVSGAFPQSAWLLPRSDVDLVIERAFLQHLRGDRELATALESIAAMIGDHGYFYSLTIARDGGSWGYGRWNDREIRELLSPWLEIVSIDRTVFTPGESGSMPAWRTIAAGRG